MSSPTLLRAYIDANASLPPDVILGNIAWYEVADGSYAAADLEASFNRHNLNPGFLPGVLNPADAFEKASKNVEGLRYPVRVDGDDCMAEILVREVDRGNQQIERHMIREIKNSSNKRLAYDKVGELVFYRPSAPGGKVDHSSAVARSSLGSLLSDPERVLLTERTDLFHAEFERFRNFHDGQKMRGVFRNYLLHLNAVLMKASVYFVHSNRGDELHRLQAFADEFDGLSLLLWQIPDLESHRVEVVEAFQTGAEKDLTAIVSEIAKLRDTRKGNVTLAQYIKLKERYDEVQMRAGEYERTLEISQDRTGAASEVAMDALIALQRDVFASEAKSA